VCAAVGLCGLAVGGCGDSPEVVVRQAMQNLPIEKIEAYPFLDPGVRHLETPARDILLGCDHSEVLPALDAIYRNAKDSTVKAKVLAAAYTLADVDNRIVAGDPVAKLAWDAWEEGGKRERYHALRILAKASSVSQGEVAKIQSVLAETDDPRILFCGYATLLRWGAAHPVIDQLMRPAPANPDTQAYRDWKRRTGSALDACLNPFGVIAQWRRKGLPEGLGARIIELIQQEPGLLKQGLLCLFTCREWRLAGSLKADVYRPMELGSSKLLVGATVAALSPDDSAFFDEVLDLLQDLLHEEGPLAEKGQIRDAIYLLFRATWDPDVSLARAKDIWEVLRGAPAWLLTDALTLLISTPDDSLVLECVLETPDDDLRRILVYELKQGARQPALLVWLSDEYPGGPGPSAAREVCRQKVEHLLEEVEVYGDVKPYLEVR